MPYRVSSLRRRFYMPVVGVLAVGAILWTIFTDPNGTQLTNVALMSVLLVWVIVMSWRWWRSSTLLATPGQVAVRTLFKTITLPWEQIDCFVAETRRTRTASAISSRRRVLGIRRTSEGMLWLSEIYCRPSSAGPTWIDDAAARLNELRSTQPPARLADSQEGGPTVPEPNSSSDVA